MATIAHPSLDLDALRARCAGAVVGPREDGYDQARQPWNVAYDQRPAAVAFPADAEDVAAIIAAARAAGAQVAVQGTGHAAYQLRDLSNAVLIRTTAMTGVEIDPVARRARVGAGVLWQDVTPAASEHGLSGIAGSAPDVGVVGYTLGGGIGYLSRKHGLACNHVTAIELVTAAGDHLRCDPETEPELFWALRGGSGRFGVITALEFGLVAVPELYAGALFWPWERSAEVLRRWRELTAEAPDELTTMARILQLPPIPEVPEPLRGRAWVNVQGAYLGPVEEGERLLAGLRELGPEIDMFAPMPPAGLMRIHGDPEGPTPGFCETAMLDALPDAALDALLAAGGPGSGSPLVALELRHLGGALAEAAADCGSLGRLDGAYLMHTVGMPVTPELGQAIVTANARVAAAVAPYGRGREYLNFACRPVAADTVYTAEDLRRLEAARAIADPDGLFVTGIAAD
ncbi:MAG TPA: FAD-binding oxidoreductase [Solirubrobacteraceae bacterium]|jgi:FAD/FMN-containing dehydrogenase